MANKRIRCDAVLGAIGLLLIAGVGTVAYAALSDSASKRQGTDVMTVFDPFMLARVAVVPNRPANEPVLLGSRRGNNGSVNSSGNGNGNRPPVVVPSRPTVRSAWAPPFRSGR
jgi:hypothetical protein